MKLLVKTSTVMLILAVLLTACGGTASPDTSAIDLVLTEGVQTMVAAHFLTQTALVTPATGTSAATSTPPSYTPLAPPASASHSPTPTWPFYTATLGTPLTPSLTGTLATPTVNPSSLAFGCNNSAFITHVNIPSGTVLKPGQEFTKIWKASNTGTCSWMYQYAVVLVSGNAMGSKTTKLGKIVTVDHWTDLSVRMDAPNAPGTYTSYWRLMDADGHMFGATFVVSITVSSPTNTPPPTSPPTSAPSDTPVPTDTPEPTSSTP